MRKLLLIFGSFLIVAAGVFLLVSKAYKDSPDYNYISAKLDVKNGNIRIVHIGFRQPSLKDKEIDAVTEKYGFKNIYIGSDTTAGILSGIDNYNDVMEAYLKVKNGLNWRKSYQAEIDSINGVAGK